MMMQILMQLVFDILIMVEVIMYSFLAFFAFCIFWFMFCNNIPSRTWEKLVLFKHWLFCPGCEKCCRCHCCWMERSECDDDCLECKCCDR